MEINNITKDIIRHVAAVARLELSEKEIAEFLPQLKDVLAVFSKISEVNTDNVKESFHPVELKNRMREDIPKEPLTQEQSLKNTEHKKDGYFKGPKAV